MEMIGSGAGPFPHGPPEGTIMMMRSVLTVRVEVVSSKWVMRSCFPLQAVVVHLE